MQIASAVLTEKRADAPIEPTYIKHMMNNIQNPWIGMEKKKDTQIAEADVLMTTCIWTHVHKIFLLVRNVPIRML